MCFKDTASEHGASGFLWYLVYVQFERRESGLKGRCPGTEKQQQVFGTGQSMQ